MDPRTTNAHIEVTAGFNAALRRVNALRHPPDSAPLPCLSIVESIIDDTFEVASRLAVYGSLAPGKENHHVIAGIGGTWSDGVVRGRLHDVGWGSAEGFPGLSWRADGARIPVRVLRSKDLADHWPRLDAFEGEDYRRILIPVELDSGLLAVANLYEARL